MINTLTGADRLLPVSGSPRADSCYLNHGCDAGSAATTYAIACVDAQVPVVILRTKAVWACSLRVFLSACQRLSALVAVSSAPIAAVTRSATADGVEASSLPSRCK